MNKKIFMSIICCLLVITFLTACNNQKTENPLISLCNKIEQDIESYQSNEITRNELYSKVDDYHNECTEPMNNICIYIKSIMSVPSDREDIQESYTKELLKSCNLERESQ